ncbi:uroporphyrinogen-III synthase [Shewanella colwelliana]|uniref:uroporphyrinogen-III synthase n=1 Tax=Shewanella colwelliana TaxID=23 RepID=UPI00048E0BF1|nr:uroporphyrinogen-III synthase [Shewanella colwelliana]
MKVLLTRPEGRNQFVAKALTQQQVPYCITPLLAVTATNDINDPIALGSFRNADIVIFISTNAVDYAAQALNNQFPNHPRYFAVGRATYLALKALNIDALEAPQDCQQTEGLLTLSALQDLAGKNVTIVRGIGGREALAEQLRQRGANVHYWQVYQRVAPSLTPAVAAQWQQDKIDTIVVTSGEILANLIKLVPKELFAWLHACHIIVPSDRVYDQAINAGFNRVTNAKAANNDAVLKALGLSA